MSDASPTLIARWATAARCELAPGPNQFTCVGCNAADGNTECAGKTDGGLCRDSDDTCVDCLGNGDCFGRDRPGSSQCGPAGTCIACSDDDDCDLFTDDPLTDDPALRACRVSDINPGCVECVNNNHCLGDPDGPRCKISTGGGPAPINTCVECITNDDCTNPAFSKCINNQCDPCGVGSTNDATANAACSHLSGLGVCDLSQGDGVCVQCTGLQRQACGAGANVCDSLNRTCTAFPVGIANICDPCVSDAHCSANGSERCALETFDGTDVAYFCFPASNQGACSLTPFSGVTQVTSIDGANAQLCLLRQTTCTAFGHFNARACTGNPDCGVVDLDDGRCLTGTCSIPCTSGIDCSGGQAIDCLGGICQL